MQELVRHALEHRIRVGDLQDAEALRNSTRIAILDELPRAKLRLTTDAVPKLEGVEVYLTSAAEIQRIADSTNGPVNFIVVDLPTINGVNANLRIGTDLVLPANSPLEKLCCCSAVGHFRRDQGRWVFVNWREMRCS